MGTRFDIVPTTDRQNIEIPIDFGLSTLHAEFTIDAPEDPPGRIVSILGLRGNLTGKGRKKKRPLQFNFTQGQDGQARWEAEITPENENGQERGPKMPFPGRYKIVIDWSASSGKAIALIDGDRFSITGPSTEPITSGFLYIGGHISKPPAPGELPVYTTPLGCRLTGFVEFNGEKIGQEPGEPVEPVVLPPGLVPIPIPPPVILPIPPVVVTPPVNIPQPQPQPQPNPPSTRPDNDDKILGMSRPDLIQLLETLIATLKSGGEIDIRTILLPILLQQVLGRKNSQDAALLAPIVALLIQRL